LLRGCQVEPWDADRAKAVGVLAGRARATDVVDVGVVECALRREDEVVSDDPEDLKSIAAAVGARLVVNRP
jgi:hypothetical protein